MMLCRNIQPRRTLRWPIFRGVWISVAAGDAFPVHATDLDLPGVAEVFDILLKEKLITIEETGLVPVLH
jgi:hypothetical protein